MSRWFRFYDDAVNNPKVQRLEAKLFKAWVNLLCLASKNEGWIPSLDDVAFSLRMSEEEAGQIVDGLISSRLLDEIDGRCCPHDWHERQYKSDSSAERVKRFRDKKRNNINVASGNVPCNVTVTVQNRTESDTETEQKDSVAKATGADAPVDPSVPEREFFKRGREVLGKNAGGLLAKLKASRGHNVALARSALEAASTKENPAEYVAAVIRGPPAKPLTAHQQERQLAREIIDDLDAYVSRNSCENDSALLRQHSGSGPQSVCGGAGGNIIELSRSGAGEGGTSNGAGVVRILPKFGEI